MRASQPYKDLVEANHSQRIEFAVIEELPADHWDIGIGTLPTRHARKARNGSITVPELKSRIGQFGYQRRKHLLDGQATPEIRMTNLVSDNWQKID